MSMYNIAGLNVSIEPVYGQLRSRCSKYLADDQSKKPQIRIAVTKERIRGFSEKTAELSAEDCEYILAGADFYSGLVHFNGMMLHASAVALDGRAYLFSAPCGTGKSTHTGLWQQYFGADRAIIINDDKPAIRLIDGHALVFGTPFSGKHDISVNAAYELGGICFLHRAEKNEIHEMPEKRAIYALLNQTLRPVDLDRMSMVLKTIDAVLGLTKVYSMGCNISQDAVRLSYETMKKGLTPQ
jgi:hypothetical protein